MLRGLVVIVLAAALQLAGLAAPLVHAHPDDEATEHHLAHEVHAHFAAHARPAHPSDHRPMVDHDDGSERAVYLRIFIGVASASVEIAAAVPEMFAIATPAERWSVRPIFGTHAHDPPLVGSASSRAPPRLPVLI